MKISEILTTYDLCVNNEFLLAYEALINLAAERNLVEHNSHSHHVIPVCYYEKLNGLTPNVKNRPMGLKLAKQDLNNFEVTLTIEEHVRAHCYLALASKEPWFIYANMIALKLLGCEDPDPIMILGMSKFPSKPIINLSQKNKKDNKLIWMTKDKLSEKVPIKQLLEHLKSGWVIGTNRRSKPRQTCKVFKNNEIREILVSDLVEYLESGWNYGKGEK